MPRVFKESVKCVLRNFKQKVSGMFQNVSIKFCFAILFLHDSHRSYPSRRRACFVLPYLSQILLKINDLGYFLTAQTRGFSKIIEILSFEKYLNGLFRENFVIFFCLPVICIDNKARLDMTIRILPKFYVRQPQ